MSIKAQCPCGKRFRAAERLLGRPVRCPHCREKFVLTKPSTTSANLAVAELKPLERPPPEPPDSPLDLLDAVIDDQLATNASPLQPLPPDIPGRRNDKHFLLARWWLVLPACLLLFGCVSIGSLLLLAPNWINERLGGGNSPKDNSIDLSYLPDDIYMLEYARIADASETEAGQDLIESNIEIQAVIGFAQLATGLAASDIESVTVGYRPPDTTTDLPGGFVLETRGMIKFVGVIRLGRDVDVARVLAYAGDTTHLIYNEQEFWGVDRRTRFPGPFQLGLYFPNDRTIVFGTIAEIEHSIDQRGRATRQPAFDLISPSDHFALVVNDRADGGIIHSQCARLGTDIEVRETIDCGNEAAAQAQMASQEFVVSQAKAMESWFDELASGMLPENQSNVVPGGSDSAVDQIDIEYRLEGRFLTRDYRMTTPDQYKSSFLLPLIYDIVPLPGSDRFHFDGELEKN